jgi:hypothetical protein
MKPGDRVYWLRHNHDLGPRAVVRCPAIYIGLAGKDREKGFVYTLEDGEVKRRPAALHNLLARTEDKEIDTAAAGMSYYTGPVLTETQLSALGWLKRNGGLQVPNMNMHGKAKEWPAKATLNGLLDRGLITFEQQETEWKVAVNDMGEALLRQHNAP